MEFSIKYLFNKSNQIQRKKVNFVKSTKKSLTENFIFVCSDLIYFQCHYYFTYRVDDVSFFSKSKHLIKNT